MLHAAPLTPTTDDGAVTPPELKATLGERQTIREELVRIPLTVEIPPGTRPLVRAGEDQGGAVMSSEGPFRMVVYFDTDDIDASIAKVRERGGKAEDKLPIPHVGWFAHCSDTEGNDFSLFQSDESVTG